MDRLVRPRRMPDFSIGDGVICFWWEEKVQSNGSALFEFSPDCWTYLGTSGWRLYEDVMWWEEYKTLIESSYATWLLEKELSKE